MNMKDLVYARVKMAWVILTLSFVLFPISDSFGAIVAGTDFEPYIPQNDSARWDLNACKQFGMSGNYFEANAEYSGNGYKYRVDEDLDFVYCVTSDPSVLNPDYMKADEAMCVIQYAGVIQSHTPFLSFYVNGLRVGTKYTVTIEYYSLNDTYVEGTPLGFDVLVNPDFSNNSQEKSAQATTTVTQKKTSVTVTGTVIQSDNRICLVYPYYGAEVGGALGITSIIVDGTIDPKISSSQGLEACKDEQTLLSLDKEYNAKTYSWQHRSGGSWQEIGTNKNLLYEKYRKNVK